MKRGPTFPSGATPQKPDDSMPDKNSLARETIDGALLIDFVIPDGAILDHVIKNIGGSQQASLSGEVRGSKGSSCYDGTFDIRQCFLQACMATVDPTLADEKKNDWGTSWRRRRSTSSLALM